MRNGTCHKVRSSLFKGVLLVTTACLASTILTGMVWAKSLDFVIKPEPKNDVTFTSDAPIEVIHGQTHKDSGEVAFDDSIQFDAKHPFKIEVSVDLASIDTGIPLRNEHMRDHFLETAKYPNALFKATAIRLVTPKPDLRKAQTIQLVATGDFTVHGVTVQKTIPLSVAYQPAHQKEPAQIRIQGKFPVGLTQHHIERPQAVFVKLAETIFVSIDLQGKTSEPSK